MKKIILLLLVLSCLQGKAQTSGDKNSVEGYWVIESNVKSPRESVIYFYNQSDELVYRERVSGKRINVNKRKVVKRLNDVLGQAVLAWQKEQVLRQDLNLVWNRKQ